MPRKKTTDKLTIALVKSLAGSLQVHKDCAAALGLHKIGDVTVQPDNRATQGKIRKIAHLVRVTK